MWDSGCKAGEVATLSNIIRAAVKQIILKLEPLPTASQVFCFRPSPTNLPCYNLHTSTVKGLQNQFHALHSHKKVTEFQNMRK